MYTIVKFFFERLLVILLVFVSGWMLYSGIKSLLPLFVELLQEIPYDLKYKV